MLRSYPDLWFRKATIEDRDRALLDAEPVSFVEYGNASYLRKIVGFPSFTNIICHY